ncbi:MAG: HAD family phosphatase [Longicatena sp.]
MKGVIFDMDGVLIDSEPANLKQLNDFYQEHGVCASEDFLASLIGSSIQYTAIESTKLLGKDWSVDEFNMHFDAYVEEHPIRYYEILNEGVRDILIYLRAHNVKTAIASSSQLYNIKRMLKECQLSEHFDVILSGEMFKESKPNPEIYCCAASKLGLDSKECMAIEDSEFGIEAALRAGMLTIAYEDLRYGVNQNEAHHSIQHMNEIKQYL